MKPRFILLQKNINRGKQKSQCTFDLCTLGASQRLLPLLHADFILCDIFVRTARFASVPLPYHNSPPAGVRYLADDLLRVHSSEVSACRGGFNDVASNVLSDFVLRVCPTFTHNALRFCVVFVQEWV